MCLVNQTESSANPAGRLLNRRWRSLSLTDSSTWKLSLLISIPSVGNTCLAPCSSQPCAYRLISAERPLDTVRLWRTRSRKGLIFRTGPWALGAKQVPFLPCHGCDPRQTETSCRKRQVTRYKGRNCLRISAFQASISFGLWYQGRRASRLPLAVIFRAVGALVRLFVQTPHR